jgi:hypothetical protein
MAVPARDFLPWEVPGVAATQGTHVREAEDLAFRGPSDGSVVDEGAASSAHLRQHLRAADVDSDTQSPGHGWRFLDAPALH